MKNDCLPVGMHVIRTGLLFETVLTKTGYFSE